MRAKTAEEYRELQKRRTDFLFRKQKKERNRYPTQRQTADMLIHLQLPALQSNRPKLSWEYLQRIFSI